MKEKFHVLITSAGRRIELLESFEKTLDAMGFASWRVMITEASRWAPTFHAAERVFEVPRCDREEYVETLLQICEDQEVDLVVPTIDTELAILARNKDEFARLGTTIAVSSPQVVAITADKIETHAWLKAQGFPTVRQMGAQKFLEKDPPWSYPLLVKPVAGSRSLGVAIVGDKDQLWAATREGDFIVQTIAPGQEYTVSFFADGQGRCRCAIPRERLEVRDGEVSKGITRRLGPVEELTWRVCDALPGAFGALNIQIFYDESTGSLNVIEINPRFGGGFPLAYQAGGDFPRWLIEEVLGRPSTARADGWREGLAMLRYDRAIYLHEEFMRPIRG